MRLKVAELSSQSGATTTRTCEARGCYDTTRENKPFCTKHVEEHPYVQRILDILREKEAEHQAVLERGSAAVDLTGLTAKELILHLSLHGSRTLERLCREFQIGAQVMRGYVEALTQNGYVVQGRTLRGNLLVRISTPHPILAEKKSARRSA